MVDCPEAGIYFQYDEEEYHALPALGSSNMKDLLSNPVLFYNRSWMSQVPKAMKSDEESWSKIFGSAYHTRILEGRDVFNDRYAVEFDASEHPDAYDSTDDIKARLRELKAEGCDVKLTGNKDFLTEQLLLNDPTAETVDELRRDYQGDHYGAIFLPQWAIDKIEYAAAFIEGHPQLSKCFTGGYPEVTIIWHHPDHPEIMLKARIDYLKLKAFIDLKTLANKYNKPTDRAIYTDMANYKYHLQATHYWDGVYAAIEFAKKGQAFGDYDEAWLKQFAQTEDVDMYYVFQQTGIAPIATGKKFPQRSIYQCGQVALQTAIELYQENIRRFGSEQWVDLSPITDLEDDEFPAYTTDI